MLFSKYGKPTNASINPRIRLEQALLCPMFVIPNVWAGRQRNRMIPATSSPQDCLRRVLIHCQRLHIIFVLFCPPRVNLLRKI